MTIAVDEEELSSISRAEEHYQSLRAGAPVYPYKKRLRKECKQIAAWIEAGIAERFIALAKRMKHPIRTAMAAAMQEYLVTHDSAEGGTELAGEGDDE